MNKYRQHKNSILFSILSVLVFAFAACKNPALSTNLKQDLTDDQTVVSTGEQTNASDTNKAYIVVTIKDNDASRRVSSVLTASLFSDITFSGTDANGHTVSETADSFAQLAQKQIYVDTGTWTFNLEAYIGKTSTSAGEKYVATKSGVVISAGENQLSMKLQVDPASLASPTAHPGNWEVTIQFPSDSIDEVVVSLFDYSAFAVEGASLSGLTPLFTKTLVKGTDYTATGAQNVTVSESSRAAGNYIINAAFNTKLQNADGTTQTQVLNNWCELMRISPGAKSTGTINLPAADEVYTIIYHNGTGAEWDTSSTVPIPLSYTKNSGNSNGKITLPTGTAFVARQYYDFLGWYEHEDFSGQAVTEFNVSDAADKEFYAKWKEPVYDVYISASGNDTSGDGTQNNPVKTANAAYALFDDLSATNADGTFKNTIHIISDYTGSQKITEPWGDGSKNGMCVNFVGEKGSVADTAVTLELDMHNCGNPPGPQTFIYIEHDQKMKFSHINFTSNQTHENPNGFGCLFADDDTELYFEDSTIKGYVANGCAAINAEGTVYLKNCEISGNKAINANSSGIWGCAVNVGTGRLHISGSVIITDNHIYGQPESSSYNLYIGTDDHGTPVFHPIIIDDQITGSQIGVLLSDDTGTFTDGFTTKMPAADPADYFHSDKNFEIRLVTGEARISAVMKIYVSSLSSSPAGDDTNGNGSQTLPYQTLAKAIQKITQINSNQTDATIYVTGDVTSNTTIVDGTSDGTQLIANSLIIEGTTTTSALNGNASGTVLDLRTGVPVTLKNLTIKNGQTSTRGGGLYIDGTNVEINNCIIENNSAYSQGGGVYLTNGAQLTMNGQASVIRSNWLTEALPTSNITVSTNKCGGGVYIDSGTTFTMNAGTIEGNGAYSGGGVYVRGTFEMNGEVDTTVIQSNVRIGKNNTSSNSVLTSTQLTANVEVGIPGTFNMNGGKITSSLTQGQCGAGVCVFAWDNHGDVSGTAKFNMSGGEISGLNISENAAVYLMGNGSGYNMEFNMSGGKITGNTATSASASNFGTCAGVFIGGNSSFNMTGGEISNNHALHYAGGVYLVSSPANGIDTPPAITFGETGSESTIIIKDNTVGSSSQDGNLYLNEGQTITVEGPLSTESQIGITRAGTFSASPFTSGFGTTNSGTSPADIFTSDEDYTIIAGTGGEAAFLTSSASGTVYAPGDYHFTLAASRSSVTLGRAANVTITPDIIRTEPNGNTTPLFYKAADHKLYLDSAFTQPEGSNAEVTWSASLWCGTEVEYSTLAPVSDSTPNKFTIPALGFENTYTMNVTATYQGYTHNANLTLQCLAAGNVPDGFVAVTGATVTGAVSGSSVFKTNRTVTIPNMYVCDHEVTQAEFTAVMGTNPSNFSTSPASDEVQENRPVEKVNWYAAIAYCNKKSLAEGLTACYTVNGVTDWTNLVYSSIPTSNNSNWNSATCDFSANGYRLPTEAEWEYIARGGNGGIPAIQTNYSGSGNVGDVTWWMNNSGRQTHEVKKKAANTLDIYDMTGNVCEWCWDWFSSSIGSNTGATGPSSGTNRIFRGGSWGYDSTTCTVSNRDNGNPSLRSELVGFRVVRNAE